MIAETETEMGSATGSATGDTKRIKKPKVRINYGLAGTLYASGLDWSEIAPQVGAKNGESVRVGMLRRGVTKRSVALLQTKAGPVQSVATKNALAGAELIRERLGKRLLDQVEALQSRPVGNLANVGQGEAAVLKTMTASFKDLHGSSDQTVIVFGVESMGSAGLEPAIDVTSTVSDANKDNT